ncbi:MAG: ATP-binding protein [Polyangiaceae bacterium]|nr:ATP-binding protein [Polyangiaceae bacterium]
MPRWFNTAGPNNPRNNYTLPVLRRLPRVRELVEQELYFVVHAPRQVGKTTALRTFALELTEEGKYTALLVSMETGAGLLDDTGAAELAMLQAWRQAAEIDLPADLQPPPWPDAPEGSRIGAALAAWARASSRPLVVFLDEIDALEGPLLVSVLRQLRDGYRLRPRGFPISLAVIGMRNVRDYKLASGGTDRAHSASPFNIAAEALTLRNFALGEVGELYAQHTAETGQVFLPEAVDRAFHWSQGQPWLVNAMARQLVSVVVPDRAMPITKAHVDQAKDILIERQDTHLDSLAERLREPRIKAVIEPILTGGRISDVPPDDQQFVSDLGLIRISSGGRVEIANPIYEEIFIKVLSWAIRASIPELRPTWQKPDGRIDFDKLIEAFLLFWRQHGWPLLGSTSYHELAPHLVLMSFLHRVVNGGGSIERDVAIGRGRMDLLVRRGLDVFAIEIKVWRADGDPDPLPEGLEQIEEYLSGLDMRSGWLVIFDRRPSAPPLSQRLGASKGATARGREITVVRA